MGALLDFCRAPFLFPTARPGEGRQCYNCRMTRAARYFLAGYYAILFGLPALVAAQAGIPTRLVPCNGAVAGNSLPACTVCHIAELAQNIINLGIFLFVFFAAIMFAYAGFMYLTDQALQGQAQAKKMFGHVAGGLVILLSAWLIVDTLMKTLLGGNFGPWNDICRPLGL